MKLNDFTIIFKKKTASMSGQFDIYHSKNILKSIITRPLTNVNIPIVTFKRNETCLSKLFLPWEWHSKHYAFACG